MDTCEDLLAVLRVLGSAVIFYGQTMQVKSGGCCLVLRLLEIKSRHE